MNHDGGSNTDHAVFRQYENVQGRWMSPDPYDGSYDFTNPQSTNRYAYVLNNPLSFVDPCGLSTYGLVAPPGCAVDDSGGLFCFADGDTPEGGGGPASFTPCQGRAWVTAQMAQ
jgi:RHS repeat-associated protein